jgi:hypothetical protein
MRCEPFLSNQQGNITKKFSRIAKLAFLEVGSACGSTFVLKLVALARNRLNFGR